MPTTADMLCHHTDCRHPRSAHGAIAGCSTEVPTDGGGTTYCRCTKFVEAPVGSVIPSRNTDPATSHKAEPTPVKAGTQRALLLQAFGNLVDATDEEAMEAAVGVSPGSEYAKRCSELRQAGLIEPTGEERVGGAGMERIVSKITQAGADRLQAVGGQVAAQPKRRSRLSEFDAHLVERFQRLVNNPNGVDGRVVLTQDTASDLAILLERLA